MTDLYTKGYRIGRRDTEAKLAARIEALEAALRDAEKEWVVSEIKLLNRIIEMIDAPHNYRRKHISDEIGLAIAALAEGQDK